MLFALLVILLMCWFHCKSDVFWTTYSQDETFINIKLHLWAGSFSRSEVLSYLYLPSSFKLFLSLFLLVIQLAKEIVLDLIGRIKAPDPWKGHTSRCHLGYIYTDPQMTVKAYPHTTVWVPIGCSTVLG